MSRTVVEGKDESREKSSNLAWVDDPGILPVGDELCFLLESEEVMCNRANGRGQKMMCQGVQRMEVRKYQCVWSRMCCEGRYFS